MTDKRRGTKDQGIATSKRLVVKIGSALLVDDETGDIRRKWLDALTDDVATLRGLGIEVVLVSSGAIAVGRRHLGLETGTLRLEEKQAAAATGQIRLAHAYQERLARHDITVAQILLTLDDTEERNRHLNARSTLNTLLKMEAVPVINENDTVATSEIRFGDNDRLAARVAAMISADTLILLSDMDGLYTADPRKDKDSLFIPEITELTAEVERLNAEIDKVVAEPQVQEQLRKLDNVVSTGTPQQFAAVIRRDYAANARIVKAAHIKAE